MGETGRSHLTSTVSLGHSLGLRGSWERSREYFKAAGKEIRWKSWPRGIYSSPWLQEKWLCHKQRHETAPRIKQPFPSLSESKWARSPSGLLPDFHRPPGGWLPGSKIAPTSHFSSKESIFQFFQSFLVTSIFLPYERYRGLQGGCSWSGLCRLVLEMALQSNGGQLHLSPWPL